ncbi:MAG: HesA/MoeB/ThiF family protein [Flavobacteriaceae bacterium]|jgi:adenylyltransferase/sulfurtransferase|nr:HesA/MoeB/ThiF family protein [Flavobacteriaceae bacterium]
MEISDFLRYNRQMNLTEVGIEGQLQIKAAKVIVLGAGGLGSPILTYLASCGVGTLAVVDYDCIEHHNLHRQILFTEQDINCSKIVKAAERIQTINPHINCIVYEEKLKQDNISKILAPYDIVVDGTDNFETRYLVNDTCVKLGKTLIYGTILGFEGQLSVFNYKGSKNLRDLFPEPPAKEEVPNCNLNGVLGTFPGIIGTMMAQETLKAILKLPVLSNQLLLIDTLHWKFTKLSY